MRKALVVGIDHYSGISCLHGCVNDAHAVTDILETNSDGSVNFGVLTFAATDASTAVDRATLKDRVIELFADDSDIALFYFAGHGHIESTGGYLCGSDCTRGDDGLPLADVITLANKSPAKNKVVVLDSCHGGIAGNPEGLDRAELTEGLTILTASTKDQYSTEENDSGVFTTPRTGASRGALM